jgi:hypothetical protein
MLKMCYFQLFHPTFFDARDRVGFFNLLMEYNVQSKSDYVQGLFNLVDPQYEIRSWRENVKDRTFLSILRKLDGCKEQYYSNIPLFIRNVHVHYMKTDRVCICNFVEIK